MAAIQQLVVVMVLSIPLSLSFGWQTTPAPAHGYYELTNGQEYLQPSTAVDPHQEHFAFAVLSPNRVNSVWKLMKAYPSCFYLCNVQTGQYLMVAANDRVYAVNRTRQTSNNGQSFIFGLYYPNWPTYDAHITTVQKQQVLCVSSGIEPINQQKLIYTKPNTPGLGVTGCYWKLVPAATCPSDKLC